MGKIEIIELIKDQIKELDTYKTLSLEDLNSSTEFSNLIYEINQSINLDTQLKNHYAEQVAYFNNNISEVNSIIQQIENDFKNALKLINPESLENAKNSQCNIERAFNIILNEMSIPFQNQDKAFFTATDMINEIINYNFDITHMYITKKTALKFLEKLEKFDMRHLYNYINEYFTYDSDKDSFNQSSKKLVVKLKEILVDIPQDKFIYNYIYADAVIHYYKPKNNNEISEKDIGLYYLLIHCYINDFVTPLSKTLKQLAIVLGSQINQNEDNILEGKKETSLEPVLFYNRENKKIKIEDKEYQLSPAQYKTADIFIRNPNEKIKSEYIAQEFVIAIASARKSVSELKKACPVLEKYLADSTKYDNGYILRLYKAQIKNY